MGGRKYGLAFDVESRHDPIEPPRHPPVARAKQRHGGGDDDHADDRRVERDGDASRLFHLQTNLRFGCVILRHYLDIERGDMFLALGRYNGSRGRAEYPMAVFAARKRWETVANADARG